MNSIELFESKPFQDVGTFNSIFTATPLIGFKSSSKVEICHLTAKGRLVLVEKEEIFLDLLVDERIEKKIKRRNFNQKKARVRTVKATRAKSRELSPLFKQLKPSEFLVYAALRELGEIQNISSFTAMLSIGVKTVRPAIASLEKKGLIVSKKEKDIVTISLTQEIK